MTDALLSAARCPTGELLLAYLMMDVSSEEQRRIDDHLETCDGCLEALAVAQRRLGIAGEVAAAVPEGVAQRAVTVQPPDRAARPAGVGSDTLSLPPRVGRRLPAPPFWRFAVPAALAASALLVVATQTWLAPNAPRRLTRSIPMQQSLRVTVAQALVRDEPHPRAPVIGTLTRGTVVAVGGEERDWYRVTLPTGGEGWVERRAFR